MAGKVTRLFDYGIEQADNVPECPCCGEETDGELFCSVTCARKYRAGESDD